MIESSLTLEQQAQLEIFKRDINSCNDIESLRTRLIESITHIYCLRNTYKYVMKNDIIPKTTQD